MGSNPTDLIALSSGSPYNFQSQGWVATTVSGGITTYDINYAYITSSTQVSDLSFTVPGTSTTYTDYYTGDTIGPQLKTDFDGEISSYIQTAIETILAPAGTVADTNYFADVANISFTNQAATAASVQIDIGTTTDASSELRHSDALAGTLTSPTEYNPGEYGDIWLNDSQSEVTWSSATALAGSEAFEDSIHELGHSLGLTHPTTAGGNNSLYYTIMTGSGWKLPGMSVGLVGLQMDDIRAIQSIYGANYSTRHGNDVYGVGHGFGATNTAQFVDTIWDGGGINVIDASSYSGRAIINLNEAAFSSIGPANTGNTGGWNVNETNYGSTFDGIAFDNVAIAYGTIIQNAIGTAGSDFFVGNQWNNVLAASHTVGGNTFYSDQLVSPINTPGVDWSYNHNPLYVGSQWNDPYYTPIPTLKNDVLIGYGANNTFFSGVGNNVIDGGYNKTDIDNATSATSSSWGDPTSTGYWDAASQFTALSNIADSTAAAGNVANYSFLSRDDSAIVSGSPGITVSLDGTDAGGTPEYTVLKGALGADGEDTLINVQEIVGSGANDVLSATPGVGNWLTYHETGGHNKYIFQMSAGHGGNVVIDDTSATGDFDFQSSVGDQIAGIGVEVGGILGVAAHSGDTLMSINAVQSFTSGAVVAYFDLTAMAAGTSLSVLDIGGYTINAQAFAEYVVANPYAFATSTAPSVVASDVDSGTPPTAMPTPIYDPTTGDQTGAVTPGYASGGAGYFIDSSLGQEIDHPWVVTSYYTSLTSTVITLQTFVEAILMYEPASDIRIVWNGPSSDTLNVYAVSEAKEFTIPYFTHGMTIYGLAIWGSADYDNLAPHADSLTSSSAGNYTGTFSSIVGYSGSIVVTYWLEQMGFSDGTVWNMQSGNLTFTSATDGQELYSRDAYDDTLVALNNYVVLNGSSGDTTMVAGPGSALYQGTGNDTDVFSTGASPSSWGGDAVELNTSGGTTSIVLHGIDTGAVTMWDTAAGEFLIQYSSTDVIRVYGGTDGSTGFAMGSLTGITFDDTTHWDLTAGLTLTATSDYQAIYGTTGGGDTLIALGTGDTLNAYAGTETLIAGPGAYLYSGTGTNTDVFSSGTAPISGGGDHVYEGTSGGTTTIAFHGIDPSAVTMWDDNYGHLTIQFSSTDQITVLGGSLDYTNGFTLGSLTQITFDDTGHTTWDLTGGLSLIATSDYQYLYGTTGGGDTLTAAGTGDTLYAYAGAETLVAGLGANLYNGTGNDIDVINSGSSPSTSSATIHANASGGTDNIIQIHDVVAADITMWDDTYGNLTVATPTDQFTVAGGSYSGTTGFAVGNIDHIVLDDSSTIGLQGSLNLTAVNDSQTIYGTGHGDNMTAAGNYDSLYGIAGNNTMTGDSGTTYFYGGSGNDTMVAGSGTNYMTMGTGSDEIKVEGSSSTTYVNGFNASNDTIHLEDVMTGYDALTDMLSNWAQKTESGGNTVIAVDPTGTGSFTAGPQVTLNSVTGLDDLATLVAHGVVHV